MRVTRLLTSLAALGILAVLAAAPASAHQPVILTPQDTSPSRGPLLPDGTVSYAVRAEVAKGQERGFRVGLARGDRLAVQLLIFDESPANRLAPAELPQVTVIDPKGRRTTLPINERTSFFEPYSRQAYLYLSRIERAAVPGTYRIVVKGRADTPVDATVAVGYREVPGQVIE